ncbi:Imm26 family immunity protein [Chryseobacterium bernardetii]|uniref:Imm26 family immunity protein n=1 Tax=Chryseobacterium bernardetii TaxID=1241978 RepID=UPI001626A737|nr:Imm26 family immunity protein [Chryseobacterium bernardetii]
MSKKLKVGDIFYLKLKDQEKYVFGRVLFDVKKQYQKIVNVNNLPSDYFPYLKMFYSDCHLVEMYHGVYDKVNDFGSSSKIIIPRVLTQPVDSKRNVLDWGIVTNQKVDYTHIEFPENLNLSNNVKFLDRGELSLRTKITGNEAESIGYKSNMCVPLTVANASLDFQERRDLIPEDIRRPSYLKDNDLYYNPELRTKIYSDLNLDPDKSYYELSKEMGFDLARFYEH